ncbi:chorismate mutase ii [hydrocarbon metagenome]|uniref:Chorismate mutase ii n=1 Tax=hydrocarbon metagenome TaxID=938273 RepID=A0A0W8E7S5_9ZZZZ
MGEVDKVMLVRGIRGATTIEKDQKDEILTATTELLQMIKQENQIDVEDIASVLFSTTSDIRSAFPALAARNIGWNQVPLLCFQEIEVPGSLPRCIRVLMHVNTDKSQDEIRHIYLKEARQLRSDISG